MARVLITGGAGQLGRAVAAEMAGRGWEVTAPGRDALDVTDRGGVLGAVAGLRPDVVIHCAAMTRVDDCETDTTLAFRVNTLGSRWVAEAARRAHAHLVAISTDYVFDGTARAPYEPWDEPAPRSVYGRSKRAGELEALHGCPGAAVVRTSWLAGPGGANIIATILRAAADPDRPLAFVTDQRGSPTFTPDLARVVADLAVRRVPGIHHAANAGEATWYEVARAVLSAAGHDPDRVRPITTAELHPPRPAPRPAYSVLGCSTLADVGVETPPPWTERIGDVVRTIAAEL